MVNTIYGQVDFSYSINGDTIMQEFYEVRINGAYVGSIPLEDAEEVCDECGVVHPNHLDGDNIESLIEDFIEI